MLIYVHGKDTQSFLDTIEKLPANKITNGMWNKLYALIAVVRNSAKVNYWIYQGTLHEYDVTNRTVVPIMLEDGMAIGNIVGGKK
jgi:hypothetical protein